MSSRSMRDLWLKLWRQRMDKRPDLIVKLFAGDALVDQSADVALWQRVLAEIRNVDAPGSSGSEKQGSERASSGMGPVASFAKAIEVSVDELQGGLSPQADGVLIALDGRNWEALKRNTPPRGPGSVSPGALAATALVMWQKHQPFGDVTFQTVRAVMDTVKLEDANLSRSLGNCDWLQVRGGRVYLNPARTSSAARLLRAYCRREAIADPA